MKKQEIKTKISNLKREIRYENKKLSCCAYGKSDLIYLDGLRQELKDLENKLKKEG